MRRSCKLCRDTRTLRRVGGISGSHGRKQIPLDVDASKAKSAAIFKAVLEKVKQDAFYAKALAAHKEKYKE